MTDVSSEETFVRVLVNEPDIAEVTVVEQTNTVVVNEDEPTTVYVSVNGARGPAGSTIINGTGAPSAGTGSIGDIYIDTTNGALWGPKTSSGWGGSPFYEPSSASLRYVHTQAVASDEWNVTHPLGGYPSVMVVDSASTVVIGEVSYLSTSQVRISFTAPFSGYAYLT